MINKLDLNEIDEEEFVIRPVVIAGDDAYLIFPRAVGPRWTLANLKYRSSVWRKSDGMPISLSFKKFFNYNEAPQITPDPTTLNGTRAFEKIDGSLLIFSRFRGEDIFRTRGTIDARQMPNGNEIDELVKVYSIFFHDMREVETGDYSFLFEWTSPANQIVLFYPKPNLRLVGIVDHRDYSYIRQDEVDEFAKAYKLERPEKYKFDSVEQLYTSVKAFEGKEGICLYYNSDQDIKKFKSLDYLAKHSFMSKVTNKDTINLFATLGYPGYTDFYKYVEGQFGWEIAEYAKPFLENVSDAYTDYLDTLNEVEMQLQDWEGKDRKEIAQLIMADPILKERASFFFNRLDGKEIGPEQIRRFLCKACGVKP